MFKLGVPRSVVLMSAPVRRNGRAASSVEEVLDLLKTPNKDDRRPPCRRTVAANVSLSLLSGMLRRGLERRPAPLLRRHLATSHSWGRHTYTSYIRATAAQSGSAFLRQNSQSLVLDTCKRAPPYHKNDLAGPNLTASAFRYAMVQSQLPFGTIQI